jgi:hypothetical protein
MHDGSADLVEAAAKLLGVDPEKHKDRYEGVTLAELEKRIVESDRRRRRQSGG